jgi:hypothetical protein
MAGGKSRRRAKRDRDTSSSVNSWLMGPVKVLKSNQADGTLPVYLSHLPGPGAWNSDKSQRIAVEWFEKAEIGRSRRLNTSRSVVMRGTLK